MRPRRPEDGFPAEKVLEWRRLRRRLELVFKRLKSSACLGHLPKRDDDGVRAWLRERCGKCSFRRRDNGVMMFPTEIQANPGSARQAGAVRFEMEVGIQNAFMDANLGSPVGGCGEIRRRRLAWL